MERNAHEMGLCTKEKIKEAIEIIKKLGTLSLIYDGNGNIDKITNKIEFIKNKYPNNFYYLIH